MNDPRVDNAEAWMGEPPAEGTRRRLIRDTIEAHATAFEKNPDVGAAALDVADRVELALLQVTEVGTPASAEHTLAAQVRDLLDRVKAARGDSEDDDALRELQEGLETFLGQR